MADCKQKLENCKKKVVGSLFWGAVALLGVLVVLLLKVLISGDGVFSGECYAKRSICEGFYDNLGLPTDSNKPTVGTVIERLGFAIGGLIGLLVALAGFDRVKALDKTAKAQSETAKAQNKTANEQERGNVEERYKNAVEQIGNKQEGVRLGGIYGLYNLAKDEEEYRKRICDFLCAYVRVTTTSNKYEEEHNEKPSIEVQAILDILIREKDKPETPFESSWINLSGAFLNGVELSKRVLKGADLSEVYLQNADLVSAELQGAILNGAHLEGAELRQSHLENAKLEDARLEGADLSNATCLTTNLWRANLQGANLKGANLQCVNLDQAKLQGADLESANLQGADLRGARLECADLNKAKLQKAILMADKGVNAVNFRSTMATGSPNIEGNAFEKAISRIENNKIKKAALYTAIFEGGVLSEDLKHLGKYISNPLNAKREEIEKLYLVLERQPKDAIKKLPGYENFNLRPIGDEANEIITRLEKLQSELYPDENKT